MRLSTREQVVRALTRRRGVERHVNGVRLRVASPTRALFTRDYDRPLADFLRSRVQPGAEVWNVGANVGIWVLQMAAWVGPGGRVVAFEPNAETADTLRENVRLNGFEPRVEVIQSAVGERVGEVDFYASGTDGMSRAGQPNPLLPDARVRRVPVTTLDAFAGTRNRVPSWILMDVEGWEIAALRGARRVLEQAQVAVEMHPSAWSWSGHNRKDFEHLLGEHGLRAVGLSSQADVFEDYGHAYLARVL
jgi:FkbM family methyltransferase